MAKSLSSLPRWCLWDLLRSAQMLKREWGAESNGNLPHLFIPCKTETFVSEFAVEDLPLDRIAALVRAFAMYMYICGFRARHRLRSLAPVMKW